LSVALCLVLIVATMGSGADAAMMYQSQGAAPASAPSSGYSGQGTPETAEELQGLVAPIALYPDALVAQILSGATFPDEIAVANYWLQQNKDLTGAALGQAVDKQTWDPSVKALTQFPSVLNNMAQNLSWTSQLGEAYHNQSSDVMAAVQTLRAQAKADGNLKSGSQITVVQQTPQTIVIQPTNPQIVYVPEYNPTVIYGTAYVTPGYSTGDLVATGLLSFGAGMAVGAMMGGGCCGWGYSSWNCNWYHGGGVYYGNHPYYGNNAWHGGYYGNGYDNANHYNNGYNSSGYHANNYNHGYNSSGYHANNYTHNTNVSGNTVNVNNANRQNANADHSGDSASSRGWGGSGSGSGRGSTAFSGFGDRSGSSSGAGGGGWGDRSASSRGWASRGGGGGWGGGGRSFGGGGGRR
jgi:uncharacterized membrane protein YgcG